MPPASLGSMSGLVALAPMAVEGKVTTSTKLKFLNHFHPHVCTWIAALNRDGIPGLLTLENQQLLGSDTPGASAFESQYAPNLAVVHSESPTERVDFRREGAYSLYNWELFFHIPTLIASRLSQNQRFEEALRWLQFVFNPTDSSADSSRQRYWKFLPFYENTDPEKEQIREILYALSSKNSPERPRIEKAVREWEGNPFKPHLVARSRITAYQKLVVMKYIDTCIAWGDQLFRRDTIESLNEATQYYILAYNILGPRLQRIPARGEISAKSYAELKASFLGELSNPLVKLENEFSPFSTSSAAESNGSSGSESLQGIAETLFFCIPQNDKLLGYWDTVEDRLFKIRHCMNIEGVVRELPLFEPPIDPALLVQAVAMGVDLSSVLNDMSAPLPAYRFNYMLPKALELCAELRSLGSALLAALEKKDAEKLGLIRASQEKALLEAMKEIKAQQVEESTTQGEALRESWNVIETRRKFYENYKENRSRIPQETQQFTEMEEARSLQEQGETEQNNASSVATFGPDVTTGTSAGPSSGPFFSITAGRGNLIAFFEANARKKNFKASEHSSMVQKLASEAALIRRDDDYQLQLDTATADKQQIEKQIAAAKIRVTIAENELTNHERQIENSAAVEDFMRSKYTNEELYGWMIEQTSAVFFQTYKLAYDMAKRSERTYRFERGLTSSNFIQFGYWDSLKKGLLSGERLYLDLKRLEMAYLEQNKREYEITRQISLVLHDPMALIVLKETGRCYVSLPEALFDMDYPGHYFRRIKTVSLTIPCVTGPHTSINCTLTLLKNKVRIDPNAQGDYLEDPEQEDNRFLTNFAAMQSIATSTAQNDTGMFELNFRDERYLPFEGAGLGDSEWRIDMPRETNAFDFDTISDVILRISYTAREGGEMLRGKALEVATLREPRRQDTAVTPLVVPNQGHLRRMFSARHEFPSEWHRFLHPTDPQKQTLELPLTQERFPFQFRGRAITIDKVELFLKLKEVKDGEAFTGGNLSVKSPDSDDAAGTEVHEPELTSVESFLNGIPHTELGFDQKGTLGTWVIAPADDVIKAVLKPGQAEDLIILCHYTAG